MSCCTSSILKSTKAIPTQFSGSGQGTLYNFSEILLKIVITPYDQHLQNLNEICQEMAWLWSFLVGGGRRRGDTNCSYLAMFKALLLPNYISEQPQYFRDASNFAKYWKNNIIYIVTFKGQRSWIPKVDCF